MLFNWDRGLNSRSDFGFLLNQLGLTQLGVEVGVWRGDFADTFLSQWKGKVLYLVDPWADNIQGYDDVRNAEFDPMDYQFCLSRMRQYGSRAKFFRGLSLEAARSLPDNLDFVYIDANHSYPSVMEDLTAWWPKVRTGGVLAGHDLFSLIHLGVTSAVAEFFSLKGLSIMAVNGDYNDDGQLVNAMSWYVIKR